MRGAAPKTRPDWPVTPPPLWASLAWGLAESTVFFLVPDIVLGWACLAGPRDGLRSLIAILAGALLGGLGLYVLALFWPDAARQVVGELPFVRGWMFDSVSQSYVQHGAAGMLYGPSSGIPYKVYAVLAPQHLDAMSFLLASIPARIERLALSGVTFALVGLALRRWWRTPLRSPVAVVYALVWCGLYAIYWAKL